MQTECSAKPSEFARVEGRSVVADFDGGALTSDAGGLLLGAADRRIDLVGRLAGCFRDARDPRYVEHPVAALVGQRVYGIALGYEDLNDHDELRHDPLMAVLAGKLEAGREDCAPVAGKSTLNRLELSRGKPTKYHKISHDAAAIERLSVDLFLEAHTRAPKQIILDLDATDDPLHGRQEGRFFHGYYDGYCYLPLYVFCGRHLLAAKLRPSNIDASAGSLKRSRASSANPRPLAERSHPAARRFRLRARKPDGLVPAEPGRLRVRARAQRAAGRRNSCRARQRRGGGVANGPPARRFKDFVYRLSTPGRARRVVAKAEWTGGEANPRFVVTSLRAAEAPARALYEDVYCARGEMENRLKECQGDLFADRTSAATMRANQLRLWFASFSYVLLLQSDASGSPTPSSPKRPAARSD